MISTESDTMSYVTIVTETFINTTRIEPVSSTILFSDISPVTESTKYKPILTSFDSSQSVTGDTIKSRTLSEGTVDFDQSFTGITDPGPVTGSKISEPESSSTDFIETESSIFYTDRTDLISTDISRTRLASEGTTNIESKNTGVIETGSSTDSTIMKYASSETTNEMISSNLNETDTTTDINTTKYIPTFSINTEAQFHTTYNKVTTDTELKFSVTTRTVPASDSNTHTEPTSTVNTKIIRESVSTTDAEYENYPLSTDISPKITSSSNNENTKTAFSELTFSSTSKLNPVFTSVTESSTMGTSFESINATETELSNTENITSMIGSKPVSTGASLIEAASISNMRSTEVDSLSTTTIATETSMSSTITEPESSGIPIIYTSTSTETTKYKPALTSFEEMTVDTIKSRTTSEDNTSPDQAFIITNDTEPIISSTYKPESPSIDNMVTGSALFYTGKTDPLSTEIGSVDTTETKLTGSSVIKYASTETINEISLSSLNEIDTTPTDVVSTTKTKSKFSSTTETEFRVTETNDSTETDLKSSGTSRPVSAYFSTTPTDSTSANITKTTALPSGSSDTEHETFSPDTFMTEITSNRNEKYNASSTKTTGSEPTVFGTSEIEPVSMSFSALESVSSTIAGTALTSTNGTGSELSYTENTSMTDTGTTFIDTNKTESLVISTQVTFSNTTLIEPVSTDSILIDTPSSVSSVSEPISSSTKTEVMTSGRTSFIETETFPVTNNWPDTSLVGSSETEAISGDSIETGSESPYYITTTSQSTSTDETEITFTDSMVTQNTGTVFFSTAKTKHWLINNTDSDPNVETSGETVAISMSEAAITTSTEHERASKSTTKLRTEFEPTFIYTTRASSALMSTSKVEPALSSTTETEPESTDVSETESTYISTTETKPSYIETTKSEQLSFGTTRAKTLTTKTNTDPTFPSNAETEPSSTSVTTVESSSSSYTVKTEPALTDITKIESSEESSAPTKKDSDNTNISEIEYTKNLGSTMSLETTRNVSGSFGTTKTVSASTATTETELASLTTESKSKTTSTTMIESLITEETPFEIVSHGITDPRTMLTTIDDIESSTLTITATKPELTTNTYFESDSTENTMTQLSSTTKIESESTFNSNTEIDISSSIAEINTTFNNSFRPELNLTISTLTGSDASETTITESYSKGLTENQSVSSVFTVTEESSSQKITKLFVNGTSNKELVSTGQTETMPGFFNTTIAEPASLVFTITESTPSDTETSSENSKSKTSISTEAGLLSTGFTKIAPPSTDDTKTEQISTNTNENLFTDSSRSISESMFKGTTKIKPTHYFIHSTTENDPEPTIPNKTDKTSTIHVDSSTTIANSASSDFTETHTFETSTRTTESDTKSVFTKISEGSTETEQTSDSTTESITESAEIIELTTELDISSIESRVTDFNTVFTDEDMISNITADGITTISNETPNEHDISKISTDSVYTPDLISTLDLMTVSQNKIDQYSVSTSIMLPNITQSETTNYSANETSTTSIPFKERTDSIITSTIDSVSRESKSFTDDLTLKSTLKNTTFLTSASDIHPTELYVSTDKIQTDHSFNTAPVLETTSQITYLFDNKTSPSNQPTTVHPITNSTITTDSTSPLSEDTTTITSVETESDNLVCSNCNDCKLPDETDCTKYFHCKDGERISHQCQLGFLFDTELQECVKSDQVSCNNRSEECPEEDGFYAVSKDCSSFINCYKGIPYKKTCPRGLFYNPSKRTCDTAFECGSVPSQPSSRNYDIECDCDSCAVPDADDCSKYYLCLQNKAYEMMCSEGLSFNPETMTCDYAHKVDCAQPSSLCLEKNGYFPISENCGKYHHCVGGVAYEKECSDKLHFSVQTENCEEPCVAKCNTSLECFSTTSVIITKLNISSDLPVTNLSTTLSATETEEVTERHVTDIEETSSPGSTVAHENASLTPTSFVSLPVSTDDNINNISTTVRTLKPETPTEVPITLTTISVLTTVKPESYSSKASSTKILTKGSTESLSSTIAMLTTKTPDICVKRNSVHPKPGDCTALIACILGEPRELKCPRGLHFSATTLHCEYPCIAKCDPTIDCFTPEEPDNTTPLPLTICPVKDILPKKGYCANFYDCTDGTQKQEKCPRGLHFNPTSRVCDFPSRARCGEPARFLYRPNLSKICPCETCLLPSTKNCREYYFCLNKTAYPMACSRGLLFDESKNTCNYANKVSCGISTTEKPPVTQTSSSVNTPEALVLKTTSEAKRFKCPQRYGLFRNPDRCGSFIQCSNWWPYPRACPGKLHFSTKTEKCESKCDAKCDLSLSCDQTDTTTPIPQTSLTSDPLCSCQNCRLSSEESCTKYIECKHGKASLKTCPKGQTFDNKREKCDWAHRVDCRHSEICFRRNGLFPVKGNCRQFVHCANGIPHVRTCPSELQFDPKKLRCEWPDGTCDSEGKIKADKGENSPTKSMEWNCPSEYGYYRHEKNCNQFNLCIKGISYQKECPKNLTFNPKTRVCDWSHNVKCNSKDQPQKRCRAHDRNAVCPENRTYSIHPHCDMYFDCSTGGPCAKRCPRGLYFNINTGTCDEPQNVICKTSDGDTYSLKNFAETCQHKKKGHMKDPANGSCYYKCSHSMVVRSCCSRNRMFDQRRNTCIWQYKH